MTDNILYKLCQKPARFELSGQFFVLPVQSGEKGFACPSSYIQSSVSSLNHVPTSNLAQDENGSHKFLLGIVFDFIKQKLHSGLQFGHSVSICFKRSTYIGLLPSCCSANSVCVFNLNKTIVLSGALKTALNSCIFLEVTFWSSVSLKSRDAFC